MAWADLRTQLQADVHAAFALPATYTPVGGVATPANVRWHTRDANLNTRRAREGYAVVDEDVLKLVIDTSEITTPARLAVVEIPTVGTFRLEHEMPAQGQFSVWSVVEVLP